MDVHIQGRGACVGACEWLEVLPSTFSLNFALFLSQILILLDFICLVHRTNMFEGTALYFSLALFHGAF